MTDLFFWLVYFGGVFAMWDRKIGLLDRLSWPFTLGEYLHQLARDAVNKESGQ